MKLYFYILNEKRIKDEEYNIFLRIEEAEAVKKNGMWFPAEGRFPSGVGFFIMPFDVGKLSGFNKNLVVLAEPDLDLAKQLFAEAFNKEIRRHQRTIDMWQSRLKAVEQTEVKE